MDNQLIITQTVSAIFNIERILQLTVNQSTAGSDKMSKLRVRLADVVSEPCLQMRAFDLPVNMYCFTGAPGKVVVMNAARKSITCNHKIQV